MQQYHKKWVQKCLVVGGTHRCKWLQKFLPYYFFIVGSCEPLDIIFNSLLEVLACRALIACSSVKCIFVVFFFFFFFLIYFLPWGRMLLYVTQVYYLSNISFIIYLNIVWCCDGNTLFEFGNSVFIVLSKIMKETCLKFDYDVVVFSYWHNYSVYFLEMMTKQWCCIIDGKNDQGLLRRFSYFQVVDDDVVFVVVTASAVFVCIFWNSKERQIIGASTRHIIRPTAFNL